jgi:adenylylsulfate kinase-like enzyme
MNIGPGFVIWLTGLPASGKTTIASALDITDAGAVRRTVVEVRPELSFT